MQPFQEWIAIGFICLILCMPALTMSVRYATCTRRAKRLPRHGTGTVTHILEEHGFDGRFARAGTGSAGTREPGIGGAWQIRFMLWNEIRPDCWFPVIHYLDETGTERSDTFDYGGFKDSWRKGEEVQIAWDPKRRGYLYPLSGKWLTKKAWLYGIAGLLLLTAGLVLMLLAAPEASANLQPVIK